MMELIIGAVLGVIIDWDIKSRPLSELLRERISWWPGGDEQ